MVEDSKAPFDQRSRVEIGAAWFRNPFGSVLPEKRVQASELGLEIEGSKVVPRAEIERAFFAPREGDRGRVVVIARALPRISIEVLTPDEAKRLLDALGLGPDRKHQRFQAQSLVTQHLRATAGMLAGCMFTSLWTAFRRPSVDAVSFWPTVGIHAALWLAVGLFFWWFLTPDIVVGAEGVLLRQVSLDRAKLISYGDILRIRHVIVAGPADSGEWDHSLLLERKNDHDIRVSLVRGERNEDEAAGLVDRIQQAHAAWRVREVPAIVESMLARGGKSARAWIASLHQIDAADEVHYRVAPVDREALFATLEDPTKEASLRVGAAVALRQKLDDEGRTRLRISAEATAEPKLRVALEQVANGIEGEELETLLDDLDATDRA